MPDQVKLQKLIAKIEEQPEYSDGKALVTICEFFDGNDDLGSIGCNLARHPSLEHFHQTLLSLEAREDVCEVWLQIYDIEEGDWPFSENVLIFGNITLSEASKLTASLEASETEELHLDWIPTRKPDMHAQRFINLWWD